MKKRVIVNIVLIVLILAAAGGGALVVIRNRVKPKKKRSTVTVAKVQAPKVKMHRNYRVRIVGYGSVRPRIQLSICPEISGKVIWKSDKFFSGLHVRGGKNADVLFKIDPVKFELAIESAQKQIALMETQLKSLRQEEKNLRAIEAIESDSLKLAKKHFDRTAKLLKRGATTDNELEVSEAAWLTSKKMLRNTRNQLAMIPQRRQQLQVELQSAGVKLRQAELDLSYTTVSSPLTGRVIDCRIQAGQYVRVGEVCGQLYGTDVMEVPISIPAGDLQWIDRDSASKEAIAARVICTAAGENVQWDGLGRIESGLEARTRTAGIVITVDNKRQTKLDINMYCKVIVEGIIVPKAFILPRGAILPDGFVYVVRKGKLAKQKISIARFTDDKAMILSNNGINEGDRVVTSVIPKPVIGMSVKIIEKKAGNRQ